MVNGNPEMKEYAAKQPSPWVSVLPLAVLTLLLYVVIRCFGGDAINGGSQIALLSATSVCVMLAIGIYRCKWAVLEEAIIDNIRASASAIIWKTFKAVIFARRLIWPLLMIAWILSRFRCSW